MGVNIEIKARATRFGEQMQLAAAMADEGPIDIHQVDTFFQCRRGRLKLREFRLGNAELIQYYRPDQADAKASHYSIYPVTEPELMRQMLTDSLGVRGVVRKHRVLYLVKNTRIHFDAVEELGEFIELEVVLRQDDSAVYGQQVAKRLRERLRISETDLLERAYVDMLDQNTTSY